LKNGTVLVFGLSVLILIGGCASVSTVNLTGRSISPATVQQIVKVNRDHVLSLKGSGSISVETPDMAQSGSFELLLHKPDSMLVKVEGPFGISVGSVLLTRTDFCFYNSFQNQLVTGAVNASTMNRIFRVNLTFDELLSLFTGGSFLAGDGNSPDSISVEDNQFVLTYRHDDGSRRYWIDPVTMLITRIQLLDQRGTLSLEERFDKFRDLGDASLPRQIRIIQHVSRRIVAVAFSDLAINTQGAPLVLDVPTNAERVRWK